MQPSVDLLAGLGPQAVVFSPHDSGPAVREPFRVVFPTVYREIMVGMWSLFDSAKTCIGFLSTGHTTPGAAPT